MSEIPKDVKNGAKYNPAMMITDQAEADAYFEKCVQHCMTWGHTREEAEYIERSNIGYWAGYHDEETRVRVNKLYRTKHPVFGDGIPRPADAFAVGLKKGQNMGVRVGRLRMGEGPEENREKKTMTFPRLKATEHEIQQTRRICELRGWRYYSSTDARTDDAFVADGAGREDTLKAGRFSLEQIVMMLEAEDVFWHSRGGGGWYQYRDGMSKYVHIADAEKPHDFTAAMKALIEIKAGR